MNTSPETPAVPPALAIQRVLVPTDFSPSSQKALQYASAFARQFGARLVLLHVIHVSYLAGEYGPVDFPLLEAQMTQAAREKLEMLARTITPAGCVEEVIIRAGPPSQEIPTVAQEKAVDLLIVSTHGYTGLKRVMLGSVAETIVRHAPCPVLVVREREHECIRP